MTRRGLSITGVGAVTASGATVAELFDDMVCGVRRFEARPRPLVGNTIAVSDAAPLMVFAAHVTDPLLAGLADARASRAFGRDSRLFVCAAVTAARNAGIPTDDATDEVGVVCGTLHAGRNEYLAIHNAVCAGGTIPINPMWGPQSSYNAPAAQLSIQLPARGPNLTLSSGTTVGLEAIVVGAEQLASGGCDTVVVGAVDTLSPSVAPRRPHRIRGPYDGSADPMGEGEAAAAMVLTNGTASGESALARLYAARQVFSADSTMACLRASVQRAIQFVLDDVGFSARDVGAVITSSAGDHEVELAECDAVATVFGLDVPVSNAVGTTGRTGGVDGLLAAVTAVEVIGRGMVPPIGGLREPRPSLPALKLVRDEALPLSNPMVLCLGVERGGRITVALLGAADSADVGEFRGANGG
jgi:3-oxoacyl-[acyl-carrier-protein] synthase II